MNVDIFAIQTPYIKRRFIEYGSGRNSDKVVVHWHEVQQVDGNLYKGREFRDKNDRLRCSFYLIYEGIPTGICFVSKIWICDFNPFEDVLKWDRYRTISDFLEDLDQRVQSNSYIDPASIAFVRQFDEVRAGRYANHHARWTKERELIRKRREKAREDELAANPELRRQIEERERASYRGWDETMSPLRFGRAKKDLEKWIYFLGEFRSRKNFIFIVLHEGAVPDQELKNGKTEYHLVNQAEDWGYVVTKTEYDFAKYLIASGQLADWEKEIAC